MTRDELRQHAAVEFAKVLLQVYLERNEVTAGLSDDVAKASVVTADQLIKRLYPDRNPDIVSGCKMPKPKD